MSKSVTVNETPEMGVLHVSNARLEAELAGVRALLDAERQRAETAERDRDRWHAAFLSLPKPVNAPQGFWARLVGRKS